jgi:hypothetical protein
MIGPFSRLVPAWNGPDGAHARVSVSTKQRTFLEYDV